MGFPLNTRKSMHSDLDFRKGGALVVVGPIDAPVMPQTAPVSSHYLPKAVSSRCASLTPAFCSCSRMIGEFAATWAASNAFGLNSSGHVVGMALNDEWIGPKVVIWESQLVPTLAFEGQAYGINDSGDI